MTAPLAAVLLVGALVSCGDDSPDAATDDTTTTTADDDRDSEGTVIPDELRDRTFLSESATEDGEERPLVEGNPIELTFETDAAGATTGCNHFGFDVRADGDSLLIDTVVGTEMACEGELMDQEEWMIALLEADPTYEIDGDRLTLTTDRAGLVLVDEEAARPEDPEQEDPRPEPDEPEAPDRRPEGTWTVESLVDGDTTDPVPDGVEATVTFTGDEVGIDICNVGGSAIEVTDEHIRVEGLITTMMACGPPEDEVERAVVGVLDGDVTYAFDGDRLTLTHPTGTGLILLPTD